MYPAVAKYYAFTFGHSTGFSDKDDVRELTKSRRVQDTPGKLNKPLTNPNLITQKAINVYTPAENQSEVLGTLEKNLHSPIIGKLKDRLSNTWYVVNVGGSFALYQQAVLQNRHWYPSADLSSSA